MKRSLANHYKTATKRLGALILLLGISILSILFLRPYHDDVTSGNWFGKRSILTYLRERLELPIYKGLGEFHIHNAIDVDSPVIQETIRMAMEDNLYIHVHTGHEAIEAIFNYEPDIKILWAHAGMSEQYETIIEFDRGWLAQLPEDITQQIAYKNAERLFN